MSIARPLRIDLLFDGDREETNRLRGLCRRMLLTSKPGLSKPDRYVLQYVDDCLSECLLRMYEERPPIFQEYKGQTIYGTNAVAKYACKVFLYKTFAGADILRDSDSLSMMSAEEEESLQTEDLPLQHAVQTDRLSRLYDRISSYRGKGITERDREELRKCLLIAAEVKEPPLSRDPETGKVTSEYRSYRRYRNKLDSFCLSILGEELLSIAEEDKPDRGGADYRQKRTGRFSKRPSVIVAQTE